MWSLSNISEEGNDFKIKIIEAEALEIIYKTLNSKRQINLNFLENSLGLVNSLSKVEGAPLYYEKVPQKKNIQLFLFYSLPHFAI